MPSRDLLNDAKIVAYIMLFSKSQIMTLRNGPIMLMALAIILVK